MSETSLNNNVQFGGRCLCGEVHYQCSSEPQSFVLCHCRDCQYVSGGGPGAIVVVPKDSLHCDGTTNTYTKPGESGGLVNRQFCATCGTHMFSEPSANAEIVVVKAGTMDDPSQLSVQAEIWTDSAQPWQPFCGDAPKLVKQS